MNLERKSLAALFVCVLTFAGACDGPVEPPSPDVVALVGDYQVKKDDVEHAYRRLVQPSAAQPSDDEMNSVKLNIVEELINQQILIARAEGLKITVADADLDKAFNDRKGNVSDEAFQQQLKERNLTADAMKQALRRELLAQKVLEQEVGSRVSIGDAEIAAFYEKNKAQFNVPETQYRIAQLVITPVREAQLRNRLNDDATSAAEADRKAQMLMERLRSGADFPTLARDYSEDPRSAPNGGDLGFVSATALNQVPAQLRNAVLTAQPGGVNLVSAGGAHTLVKLVSREAPGQRELNAPEVREGITNALKQRKDQLYRAALLAAAKNDVDVRNYLAAQLTRTDSTPSSLAPASGS
jgi:peptidyl-prolyl cis-trans isomerase SurA